MVEFSREFVYSVFDEVAPLLQAHYQELTLNKNVVSLDPAWERYGQLEIAGRLALFTARDKGKLVGYSAFFVDQHIHYAGLRVATNDVLFLDEGHRKGTTGTRLIRFSEDELKKLGVQKITWHVKYALDFRPILRRMGYADEEAVVGKMI